MAYINRRHLFAGAAAGFAGATTMLGGLGARRAWAADTSGYKALVCVFLKGGMDHADTIIPVDLENHDLLGTVRAGLFNAYNVGSGSSSRDRANLLSLNADNISSFAGRTFGLPTELAPLHTMFEDGDLAVVGNVGPLIEPTTRSDMNTGRVQTPARLFSHNDQQSTWMSLNTEGARVGWGGHFADQMVAANTSSNPIFSVVATTGNDVFLSGETVKQFKAPSRLPYLATYYLGGNLRFDASRNELRDFLERTDFNAANLYEQDVATAAGQGVLNLRSYSEAMNNGVTLSTSFPSTNLGSQLQIVARTIDARSALNVRRQIFFVAIGGFDTHSNQHTALPNRHAEIAGALDAFKSAMIEIGMWNAVTLFTASDFGRTTIDNGNGTDHGWGAHHFVMGGSVAGKRIYGDLPTPDIDSESYTRSRGRLIPSVSVDQYASTLGAWFGLEQSEMADALPNLPNFAQQNLGFMGGAGV